MMETLNIWINNNPEQATKLGQEEFILDVTEKIWEAMENAGVTKQELALRLKCSKANITRLLDGERNMTLRSLYEIALAISYTPSFNLEPTTKSLGLYKDAKWNSVDVDSSCKLGKLSIDMSHFEVVHEDWLEAA